MTSEEKIRALSEALEQIRELTFQPYYKNSPTEQRPATPLEKKDAWSRIQATAAGALRYVEDA